MNKKQTNARPATAAQSQGNDKPKLIKAEGNTKAADNIEAINHETGLAIFKHFRFEIPSEGETELVSSDPDADASATGLSFSRFALLEAKEKAQGDLAEYIQFCEDAAKALKKAGEALITPHIDTYAEWIKGLKAGEDLKLANKAGSSLILNEDEFDRSAKTLAYSMAKISNSLLFGKPASEGKPPTPSIFYNPEKVAKLGGFEGGNRKLRAMASVRHLIVDNEGLIEHLFTQIGILARQILHHNHAGAGETWRRLTGKIVNDRRVVLDERWLADWTQARMFGSMSAMFSEEARKATKAKKLGAISEADAERMEAYRKVVHNAIQRQMSEAENNTPKTERIGGSRAESSDTRATLPDSEEAKALQMLASRHADKVTRKAYGTGEITTEERDAYWSKAYAQFLSDNEPDAEETAQEADAATDDDADVETDVDAATDETEQTES